MIQSGPVPLITLLVRVITRGKPIFKAFFRVWPLHLESIWPTSPSHYGPKRWDNWRYLRFGNEFITFSMKLSLTPSYLQSTMIWWVFQFSSSRQTARCRSVFDPWMEPSPPWHSPVSRHVSTGKSGTAILCWKDPWCTQEDESDLWFRKSGWHDSTRACVGVVTKETRRGSLVGGSPLQDFPGPTASSIFFWGGGLLI